MQYWSWIDYLNVINYFRIRMVVIGSAANKTIEVSIALFNNFYVFNNKDNIEKIVSENGIDCNNLLDIVPSEYFSLFTATKILVSNFIQVKP